MVAWDNLCKPKDRRRINIREPQMLRQAMDDKKNWWIWVKNHNSLWEKLWKNKYAHQIA